MPYDLSLVALAFCVFLFVVKPFHCEKHIALPLASRIERHSRHIPPRPLAAHRICRSSPRSCGTIVLAC